MILNGNNGRQGVIKTPCLFYFGCYIDTLCGRTLRNRMSGAAARHFFFLEKVRTASACIGNNINQIARKANAGFATKEDVRELKFLMRTIETKMTELVKQ